ncbi:hypothetical protein AAMO2058_001242700 [Amorphochlora amoebiformis]
MQLRSYNGKPFCHPGYPWRLMGIALGVLALHLQDTCPRRSLNSLGDPLPNLSDEIMGFSDPKDTRVKLLEEHERLQNMPLMSPYRYYREKLLERAFSLLRKQEEDEIYTEDKLLRLLEALSIVPAKESWKEDEIGEPVGGYPCPEYNIEHKAVRGEVGGGGSRSRYFNDEPFVGWSAVFPPGDLTTDGRLEMSIAPGGALNKLVRFENFSSLDKYINKMDKEKLDWAEKGGKPPYPVDPYAFDNTYYDRLERLNKKGEERRAAREREEKNKRAMQRQQKQMEGYGYDVENPSIGTTADTRARQPAGSRVPLDEDLQPEEAKLESAGVDDGVEDFGMGDINEPFQ